MKNIYQNALLNDSENLTKKQIQKYSIQFTKSDQLNVLKIIFLTRTIPTFFMFFSP